MRILFLGTPEFAVPSLQKLLDWKEATVVGLVTQPDRPAGRGNKIIPPPSKVLAEKHGIPVLQPERLSKAPDIVQAMRDLNPDILVTVAFGQILKKSVLEMAPHGVMNVHGSLLPKYRGAAPINWAIINGEKYTGITTMFSDAGVDTGDMLLKSDPVAITDEMDAGSLAEILSVVAADLLVRSLEKLMKGELVRQPQDNDEATYAPRLTKEMGCIDWHKSGEEIHNLVRGLAPWPGTYTHIAGIGRDETGSSSEQALKIMKTRISQKREKAAEPGGIISSSGSFLVACGPAGMDTLEVLEVKPANKGTMSATSWLNGLRAKPVMLK